MFTQTSTYEKTSFFLGELREKKDIAEKKCLDYYPFGMLMPGRNFNTTTYRHGFNGKEKDDELKGSGNSYDYGMRIYDPRLGRFLSVDPLTR
ncbi:MAG: RHS repeat-associated core domain-containing protein, partial [Bacteroidales bacterium]